MRRSQKSKRVTWASDVNLCQVKLFSSEEYPSQVGLGTQDHLQAKALWPLKSGVNEPDDSLPPGFEGIQPANPWRVKLSQIPLIKWRRPPKFEVNIEWQVVAGEESKEVEAQNRREMRVLEAIYPRPSAIPPNPSPLVDMENSFAKEENTPLIPATPIEDDDAALDTSLDSLTANRNPMISQPQLLSHGTCSHANATSSVLSNSSNRDQRNLVDQDLLVKILSDPKMIKQLITSHGTSFSAQSTPSTSTHYVPSLRPPMRKPEFCTTSMAAANGPVYPPQIRSSSIPNLRPSTSPSLGAPTKKDINYYKSLIQQHGGERRDDLPKFAQPPMRTSQEHLSFVKSRESKPKIMKPCIYFNSYKGCRNGANCAYQHDTSSQHRVSGISEVHNAKRVKLDGGITG